MSTKSPSPGKPAPKKSKAVSVKTKAKSHAPSSPKVSAEITQKTSPEVLIKDKSEELLAKLGYISEATVVPRDDGGFDVQISSEDPNLLIGYHGQTLSALQVMIGLSAQKSSGNWVRLSLNVGDYRERREEQLRKLALTVAQRVRFSGQPQVITKLSPAERRIVHLTLANDEMVETVSEGEGLDRHLIIRPKNIA